MKDALQRRASKLAQMVAVQGARNRELRSQLNEAIHAQERSDAAQQLAYQQRVDQEADWENALCSQGGFDPILTSALAHGVIECQLVEADAKKVLFERAQEADRCRVVLRAALKSEERGNSALRTTQRAAAKFRDHASERSLEERTAWAWWRIQQ